MPPKKNPLKLNKLQLRTLALAQLLAQDSANSSRDEATGAVTLLEIPVAHGDHFHIGELTVSKREASGLTNPSVWSALRRKGLANDHGFKVIKGAGEFRHDTNVHILTPIRPLFHFHNIKHY